MRKYKIHYNNRSTELDACSLYEAVQKGREFFKPPKSKQHMVSATLMTDAAGNPVAVDPASL